MRSTTPFRWASVSCCGSAIKNGEEEDQPAFEESDDDEDEEEEGADETSDEGVASDAGAVCGCEGASVAEPSGEATRRAGAADLAAFAEAAELADASKNTTAAIHIPRTRRSPNGKQTLL